MTEMSDVVKKLIDLANIQHAELVEAEEEFVKFRDTFIYAMRKFLEIYDSYKEASEDYEETTQLLKKEYEKGVKEDEENE